MEERKIAELSHNKTIIDSNKQDFIWGWNSVIGRRRLQRRADIVDQVIQPKLFLDSNKECHLLELGCGVGLFTKYFKQYDRITVTSLDIYDEFVKQAKERLSQFKDNLAFVVADAEILPFKNEAFDFVVGISVLHHLDLEISLKELKRVLKRKGIFVFSEPNMMNPQIFFQKNIPLLKKISGDSPYETAFYRKQLYKVFQRFGFNVSIVPFDFLHPMIPRKFVSCFEKLGLLLENNVLTKHFAGSLIIKGENYNE